MKIAVPKERRVHETRVAATPETIKKLVRAGATVAVETGAGIAASITDSEFTEAGATIASDFAATLSGADVVPRVTPPTMADAQQFSQAPHPIASLPPH